MILDKLAVHLEIRSVKKYSRYQYRLVFAGVRVCVCVVIPFILDVRFVNVPAGVTQDFSSTFLLRYLP